MPEKLLSSLEQYLPAFLVVLAGFVAFIPRVHKSHAHLEWNGILILALSNSVVATGIGVLAFHFLKIDIAAEAPLLFGVVVGISLVGIDTVKRLIFSAAHKKTGIDINAFVSNTPQPKEAPEAEKVNDAVQGIDIEKIADALEAVAAVQDAVKVLKEAIPDSEKEGKQ